MESLLLLETEVAFRARVRFPPIELEVKRHDDWIPLWEKYGDPEVATWDMDKHSKPVARS
jgi:hypothetical protein